MEPTPTRPAAVPLSTRRLDLEPLRLEHADEAVLRFDDPALHTFIGGTPPTLPELTARFTRQLTGHSPDGTEDWLNWMARDRASGRIAGTVQAQVYRSTPPLVVEVAWVVAVPFQRQGLAVEAAGALVTWLREQGADVVIAHIHPDHAASEGVARALGLHPTDTGQGGERRWSS